MKSGLAELPDGIDSYGVDRERGFSVRPQRKIRGILSAECCEYKKERHRIWQREQ